jgi:hypothetical protein
MDYGVKRMRVGKDLQFLEKLYQEWKLLERFIATNRKTKTKFANKNNFNI